MEHLFNQYKSTPRSTVTCTGEPATNPHLPVTEFPGRFDHNGYTVYVVGRENPKWDLLDRDGTIIAWEVAADSIDQAWRDGCAALEQRLSRRSRIRRALHLSA